MFAGFFLGFAELVVVPIVASLWVSARSVVALRQTTLLAPALWLILAVVSVVPPFLHEYRNDTYDGTYERYVAAVLLIAPTLAMLGAKRPQNGAWQFIVLTLVGVLLLPVLQGWAFGNRAPHVHLLFRGVMLIHVLIGVVNYLPTRYCGPALSFGLTQSLMCAEFFPFGGIDPGELWQLTAWGLAFSVAWARVAARQAPYKWGLDLLWRDFRDMYGLVWGLRIAERLNASAIKHRWPVEFTWGGMIVKTDDGTLDDELRHRIEREMRSHLRRFVSHDWIAARLHPTP